MNTRQLITISLLVATSLGACRHKTPDTPLIPKVATPDWARNSVIYEVNLRQYTPEGTLAAFEPHLPRLRNMGVDILWLMPVHPIGIENRKEGLGSYYSVKDYKGVNPELGTLDDLKRVVNRAHDLGMKVILDWVANHTAWDNPWVVEHPQWYLKNSQGNIEAYVFDNGTTIDHWTDVVGLDYTQPAVHRAMTDAMLFWVKEANVDGFRCDVAGLVPASFWNHARRELQAVKPIFMLAENEDQHFLLDSAFNANYAWSLKDLFNGLTNGKSTATAFERWLLKTDSLHATGSMPMLFTTNHDENSWHGSEYERLGDAVKAATLLTFTAPGLPLIYSGQEAGLSKRLRFFEKDTIHWDNLAMADFFKQLTRLKKENPALANAAFGGKTTLVATSHPEAILAFTRQKGTNTVVSIINLSNKAVQFKLQHPLKGEFEEYFSGQTCRLGNDAITLPAWGYHVYRR